MNRREEDLLKLRSYTEEIDKDLTMILQSLQWDRKHILQHPTVVSCKHDSNHKVISGKVEEHERNCILRRNGYSKDECLLPDPLDVNSSTLIKLGKEDIAHIIENAAKSDPLFKKVCVDTLYGCIQLYLLCVGSGILAPQSLGRLQCAYSADERRVIHDAVVSAAPACHDLADLALISTGENDQAPKTKTRTEILAELRDMRRRRTKYRVAAKSRNYSDVLRDVIKTQMEHYNEVLVDTKPNVEELNAAIVKQEHSDRNYNTHSKDRDDRHKHDRRRESSRPDKDYERSRREHSDKDRRERRYEREDSRNRERSRERRHYNRNERDHRHNELEATNDDFVDRDRSKETKHRRKSKEREYDYDRDRIHMRKERHSDREPERSRRRYDDEYNRDEHKKEKRKEQDRRKDDGHRDDTNGQRARNLLLEIKQEIEAVEDDNVNNKDESTYTGSIEDKHEKSYRDNVSKGNGHQRHDTDKDKDYKYRHRERHSEEGNSKHRKREHTKDKEREESSYRKKHKKSKDDRKERRDRSSDKEMKKSRTEDKHRIYYEIYSELDSRRNKYENK